MHYAPLQYTIVAMDVAGSGSFDDRRQLRMRQDLRTIVSGVLALQDIDYRDVDFNDLGDGLRLIVAATVTPRALLDPFIPDLAAALHHHRGDPTGQPPLRLRVAVHLGLLHRDGGGWAGEPLVHCARLLEAGPVRQVLAGAVHADLVLVVSQAMYDAVVRHGYGLDPSTYRRITIREKETTAPAWVHVPGYATPPSPVLDATPAALSPASQSQLARVVEALLDIPAFAAPDSRQQVLALIRPEVAGAIPRHAAARVDAFSIVRTCLGYAGGLPDLVEAVRQFAGGSTAMRRLDEAVIGLMNGRRSP
jgi:hypothetical protein